MASILFDVPVIAYQTWRITTGYFVHDDEEMESEYDDLSSDLESLRNIYPYSHDDHEHI